MHLAELQYHTEPVFTDKVLRAKLTFFINI